MEWKYEDPELNNLKNSCSNIKSLLQTSVNMQISLAKMDRSFDLLQETLSATSKSLAPLQTHAMTAKALETRINRAMTPALTLLKSFKLAESLQHKLLSIGSKLSMKHIDPEKRLHKLIKYVDCVDQLNSAIDSVCQECEPTLQKLQETVEFLSRTKATDQFRIQRLRETLVTLKALYETEIGAMRYEGLLDEALLTLQDEYENILLQLNHALFLGHEVVNEDIEGSDQAITGRDDAIHYLGSELEVQVLRRISETLTRNDCLDICIDIFVKARYRRAAKALMRLNPDYLRRYTPEEINEMEWVALETSITLWIQHFQLAVKTVFVSEKKLCNQVFLEIMDGLIWAECFVKITDKFMAVFFRFGEGVARSSKEPQKLFKLLDMFESLEKLEVEFSEIFDGDAGNDICSRFRELQKLLVHASTKVFWEFGLQIEGNHDGFPPPQDGSVPKLVRYAVNYLKYLSSDQYQTSMAKVIRIEQMWKAGFLSKPDSDENLLQDAISNVMEALERNIEFKKSRYKDRVLPHVFSMNTYWYIYMRSRNSELGNILGEQLLKKKYKTVAEESAYMYQRQAWGPIVKLLENGAKPKKEYDTKKEVVSALARGKMEAFKNAFEDNLQKHRGGYYNILDEDLKEQLREATVNLVVPVYVEYLETYSLVLKARSFPSPDSVQAMLVQVFSARGNPNITQRRHLIDQLGGRNPGSADGSSEIKEFKR
ncbi:exocyst complex component EXO70A1-like [Papaver somniferum]|uniref:exocyst complex component EXO70A1-like n=1 Tax=Papaver somniferum TaxID=3469 RepID=UPI000E702C0D|nr:exocyst complex component EXO70A1-like [Papaver somniferum]